MEALQHITVKSNRGGRRMGSGSKPLPKGEKKMLLRIYVKEKYLTVLGNDKAKEIAEGMVEREAVSRLA